MGRIASVVENPIECLTPIGKDRRWQFSRFANVLNHIELLEGDLAPTAVAEG